MHPRELRRAIRNGDFTENTFGRCPGYVQANLAIVPQEFADDFRRFCKLNYKACPVLAEGETGSWELPALGEDLDIRTDVSKFCLFADGQLTGTVASLKDHWRDDLVVFALGCSYSFEHLLMSEDLPVRHLEIGTGVPAYRTNIPNVASGIFEGNLVVSMRPFRGKDAIRAIELTSRHPKVHGAPVHIGNPQEIGIADVARADFGGRSEVRAGELPVFWACGVTPQEAMRTPSLPFGIGHAPGHMLVTDLPLASVLAS